MKAKASILTIALSLAMAVLAFGEPDQPVVEGSAATYSGDQSGGVSVTSGTSPSSTTIDTLNLSGVGAGVVVPGIVFASQGNREVNINLGSVTESINVATTAAGSNGVTGTTQGTWDVKAGGGVNIVSNGAVQTAGTESYGIYAASTGGTGPDGAEGHLWNNGGTGANGQNAGAIAVTAGGSVKTVQKDSNGIVAVSSGGQGGKGGEAGVFSSAGGSGAGGSGGAITVNGGATIQTSGEYSSGIAAVSTGGTGGYGGEGYLFSGGRPGGYGGLGGAVTVDGTWNVATSGDHSMGIWAKSVGGSAGSGGNGGWASSGPGGGGIAANGGAVTLKSGGLVTTEGKAAYGLHAQSVGGFGGAGGTSSGFFWSFGGDANSGGSGGAVSVENLASGAVVTMGEGSHAISAQSVGGGGGSGGGKFGALTSLGGAGGAGGNGGSVAVTNAGRLETSGLGAYGVLAQSVGGGGGDGGSVGGLVGIGGTGSQTSDGGNVTVDNLGTILTHGLQAHGIFAESVGGGGGNGGRATGLISFGGDGGSGGDAGTVSVVNEGSIRTDNKESYGIFAQSVGGGGGSGGGAISISPGVSFAMGGKGAAGGDAAAVSVDDRAGGSIATAGERSYGVFAQSVGGGGGDGGFTVSASALSLLSLAIGGSAGPGGDGGTVAVTVDGSIATAGERAYGVLAQSVGGGGGAGGFAIASSAAGQGLNMGLGGSGGVGGIGDTVTVDIGGSVATTGLGAHAVFAQSVGGGGGDGGFAVAGSIAATGPTANIAIGGDGGSGNVGGNVIVASSGAISTQANDAHGILAQSVGGSGGNGGYAISASVGGSGVNMGFGGDGGTGSSAGNVTLGSAETALGGTITTQGDRSYGILAQSVGGGGGNGGATITGQLLGPQTISLGFGGTGGDGGLGSAVSVHTDAGITTAGSQSHGILAQSVGGGGGTGGLSIAGGVTAFGGLSLAMGGDGGLGNSGGAVDVKNGGSIETSGEYSYGIFSQSVGGKGGAGGTSGSVMVNFSSLIPIPEPYPTGSVNIALSLGGDGGSGGVGGQVNVGNEGKILTREDFSYGILAQSIGGGGGDGGKAIAATANIGMPEAPGGSEVPSKQKEVKVDFAMALGGDGGSGNDAGKAVVDNSGSIETLGDGSHGIFAQSVGGGGGSGGSARSMNLSIDPSNWKPETPEQPDPNKFEISASLSLGGSGGGSGKGGTVDVTNEGSIITRGADAYGILAQSVGGGGGIAGGGYHGLDWQDMGVSEDIADKLDLLPIEDSSTVSINLGGSGTSGGGNGDKVTVANSGSIATMGGGSIGIYAQSIGGGGGIGGAGASTSDSKNISLGGGGGAGGNGGDIDIGQSGSISTTGVAAHGIFAQSVGGGGGYGGNVDKGVSTSGVNLGIGGSGGAGGNGGAVKVASAGTISTTGDGAIGVIAQSVGGGGGLGGVLGDGFGFAGSAGNLGEGGAVTVTHTGSISTTGKYAHGILAQSVGGANYGGDVAVTVAGDITVTGEGAVAVLAQSAGQAGAKKIDFIYQSGTITGNSDGAVKFLDGTTNSFTNRGVVTTVTGPKGTAFLTADGDDSIQNYGTVSGKVDLGSGANSFTNFLGSIFNSGDIIKLGTDAASKLLNGGTLSVGGLGEALVSTLTGSLEQSDAAKLIMELDLKSGLSDVLQVSGLADLAGQLQVGLVNAGFAADGSYTSTLISAAGGLVDQGLELLKNKTAVLDYALSYASNGTDLLLELIVDKTPADLSAAQEKIGDLIESVQGTLGAESFSAVAAKLFELTDVKSLGAAYEQISDPATFGLSSSSSVESSDQYTASLVKRMHSVRSAVQSRVPAMKIKQVLPNATWLESFGLFGEQQSEGGVPGYDPRLAGTTAGYDRLFRDGFLLGLSAGLAKADIDMKDSTSRSDIDSYFGSLYGSIFSNKAYADLALSYGLNQFQNLRAVQIGSATYGADSEHEGRFLSAYLESGYNLFAGTWLFEPYAALRFGRLDEDAYAETGLEGAGLSVKARQTDSLLTDLGLRLSTPFALKGWAILPEASVAWNHDFPLGNQDIVAAFRAAPSLTFTSDGADLAPDGLTAGFGLTIISKNHVSISAAYKGEFREGYAAHSFDGGLRFEF